MERVPGDEVQGVVDAWRRERPDLDVSSIGIVTPLVRLAALVAEARSAALATHGLDQSHLDVLATLRRAGEPFRLTAGELSRRCRVTPGATTQRVAALEKPGFVERVREEPDRRTVHVRLTARGRQRVDEILADVLAADDRLLAGLAPQQRQALEDALRTWLGVAGSGGHG